MLDGLWRLTVGANKGLFLYFPFALLAIPGFRRVFARDRKGAMVAAGFLGFLVLSTAAWWSWDGAAGWGPRLLVPLVPLLAALARPRGVGPAEDRGRRSLRRGSRREPPGRAPAGRADLLLLLHACRIGLSPPEERPRWPDYACVTNPATGATELLALYEVARNAALSPIRLHAALLGKRLARE